MSSLPVILAALRTGKVTPRKALLHAHKAPDEVKRIFKHVHDKQERYELNLYVVGEDQDAGESSSQADAAGSHLPAERSPNQ
jgi:succinate dehydrogenase / fumarate reductase, iron-sulfur subunit